MNQIKNSNDTGKSTKSVKINPKSYEALEFFYQ